MKVVLVFLLLYSTSSESRYQGKPIQVKADFHVLDENPKAEKRPRPFLNAHGQIDFHTTTTTVPTTITYQNTFRPENAIQNTIQIPHLPGTVYYKPTFRPPVLIADISNVAISTPAAPTKSEPIEATTTTAHEKIFDLAENLNQLSVVEMSVLFGFPVVTALLSLLGFGPLAIASAAWVIPLVTLYALPELSRGEQIEERLSLNL